MIGSLGNIVFETSDKRILTFSNFSHSVSGRWNTIETIGGKPKKEYLGADTQSVTFDVILDAVLGVSPSKSIELLESMVFSGKAYPFFIGGKPVGKNAFYWILTSVSESWDVILNDGKIIKAKVSLSLEEYQ